MRMSRALMVLVCGIAFSTPALSATLSQVQGQVMVNRGQGFRPVTGPTNLSAGNSVMVSAGGSAQISYPDGCSSSVAVGSVVTVGAQSPCATSQPGTGTGTGSGNGTGLSPLLGPTAGIFAVNVGVIGAIVGTQLANQNNDRPASP